MFDKEGEVRAGLLEFADTNRFADAHLTAIGAFSQIKLGFFDPGAEWRCAFAFIPKMFETGAGGEIAPG